MTIYVETLSDVTCRDCKQFVIIQQTVFADGEIAERFYQCKNLGLCRKIHKQIKESQHYR